MSWSTFVAKLQSHLVNGLANALPGEGATGRLRVVIFRSSGVRVGRNARIARGTYINGRNLTIGGDCTIGPACYFDLAGSVTIGDRVSIGSECIFLTSDHEIGPPHHRAGPVTPNAVSISDGACLGARVMVLPGVSIGRGTIVHDGSVVISSLPENVMASGVPAVIERPA